MKTLMTVFLLVDMMSLVYSMSNDSMPSLYNFTTVDNEITKLESAYVNCNAKQLWKIYTTCHTPFMKAMQKKRECMPMVEKMLKCRMNLYNETKCYEIDDIQDSLIYVLNGTAKVMCKKAGLDERPIYQVEKVNGGTRYLFPCTISSEEYVRENKKCNSKMIALWKNNTADPRICREFYNTKQCKKQLVNTKCNYTGEYKKTLDLAFGKYNPFCTDGVDFTKSRASFILPFGGKHFVVIGILFVVLMSLL